MNNQFQHIPDLLACFTHQPDSIVSRTLHNDEQSKAVLFKEFHGTSRN